MSTRFINNTIFAILFIVGAALAPTLLLSDIHEQAHVIAFGQSGIPAVQVDQNHTAYYGTLPSISGLFAGFWQEIVTAYGLAVILLIISNPAKNTWRRHYWYIGLPWGYANCLFFYAFKCTDLNTFFATEMQTLWMGFNIPVLIVGWGIIFFLRLRRV